MRGVLDSRVLLLIKVCNEEVEDVPMEGCREIPSSSSVIVPTETDWTVSTDGGGSDDEEVVEGNVDNFNNEDDDNAMGI